MDKYPEANVLDLGTNQGLPVATNWGVYNSSNDYILVVNDDNVFPLNWDVELEKHLGTIQSIIPVSFSLSPDYF